MRIATEERLWAPDTSKGALLGATVWSSATTTTGCCAPVTVDDPRMSGVAVAVSADAVDEVPAR